MTDQGYEVLRRFLVEHGHPEAKELTLEQLDCFTDGLTNHALNSGELATEWLAQIIATRAIERIKANGQRQTQDPS